MTDIVSRAASPGRHGLTLVEVIAALVLVTIGLLGMAGTSALLLRGTAAQAGALRATRQATLRIAALAAAGCGAARDGAATDAATGLRERWHVAAPVNGARMVEHTAEWVMWGRARQVVVRSALLC